MWMGVRKVFDFMGYARYEHATLLVRLPAGEGLLDKNAIPRCGEDLGCQEHGLGLAY